MSTLRVDKIAPFSSSSIEIEGDLTIAGGATTGSNNFVGNQTVTGSIDITGEFLVNGTPISGSGGGETIDTGSFATTGSNTFNGDQTVNGKVEQIINAPTDGNQLNLVTVNGVSVDGKPYNIASFSFVDLASVGPDYEDAFMMEFWDGENFNYGNELKVNGRETRANLQASGSASGARISIEDKYDGTTEGRLQADNIVIGKSDTNSITTIIGRTIVAPIDDLPETGIPGQITFQGGNMWVYINGQWNQVQFVPAQPQTEQYFTPYSDVDAETACSSETIEEVWTDTGWFVGGFLYTDDELTNPAANGFYVFNDNVYEVDGGEMVSSNPCNGAPTAYYFSSVGYNATNSAAACTDNSAEFYTPCSVVEIGCRLSPGDALVAAVDDGFYALSGSWFEVTGGDGEITDSGSCD